MNIYALDNYRMKTEEDLKETFKNMNEAATSGMWLNFDHEEWLGCAKAMLQVIEERGGFKNEN